jgi:hypothetical protein
MEPHPQESAALAGTEKKPNLSLTSDQNRSYTIYIYVSLYYTCPCMFASARRTPLFFSLLLCFGGHLLVLSSLGSIANLRA